MELIKVSSNSVPGKVAGAIAGAVRGQGKAVVQGIGAGAVNQAVKAIAIARGFLAPQGVDLVCIPGFANTEIDGEERSAIRFTVKNG
ncbi:stage V sporulation protein S [Anaerospora hongkongensis]|uniref:Stage V sporulation protein S n=1 Tax=Anaerospora hongkongensis TaxID=244830 RepID=A0A4R1QBZ0_9FIRM|nr:stage V sporulation protein S [Anaerospora hongkongensis]TCL39961.1 stage V sporulation protein S [Anaerospora hongkongensis]